MPIFFGLCLQDTTVSIVLRKHPEASMVNFGNQRVDDAHCSVMRQKPSATRTKRQKPCIELHSVEGNMRTGHLCNSHC